MDPKELYVVEGAIHIDMYDKSQLVKEWPMPEEHHWS